MSSPQEQQRSLSYHIEHDSTSIGAASSMTFQMGEGTDTGTTRYMNLPDGFAYGIQVTPTVGCSVTEINGRTLKAAMSIGVGGWVEPLVKIKSFTITAGTATVVEVEVKA